MSLLSAGKRNLDSYIEISAGSNKAYGRGLFIPDPSEAEARARKQERYQEELRQQMEEDRRRKQERKRKEEE